MKLSLKVQTRQSVQEAVETVARTFGVEPERVWDLSYEQFLEEARVHTRPTVRPVAP